MSKALIPGRPGPVTFSLFDSPRPERAISRRDKLMSVEFEVGGLGVELKAKSARGIVTGLALFATLAAIAQELMRPRQFRTWHGHVFGVIPYDFRKPTLSRFANTVWAPDTERLFRPTAFGVGWTINLAQLPRALLLGGKAIRREVNNYQGPKLGG